MKYIKWPLIVLASLFAIYCILCLVGPKNIDLSKELKMDAKPAHVYNLISDLKNWETWSSWNLNDTAMVISYPAATTGVGGYNTWIDKNGGGKQEIIELEKNKRMKTKLTFKDWDGNSYGNFDISEDGGKTHVKWSMSGDEDFSFLQRGMIMLMGMKGDIKKNYAESLQNIKAIVEPRAKGMYDGYKIQTVDVPEKSYVMNRSEVQMKDITQFYSRNLPSIANKVGQARLLMDGQPSGLFFKWDEANGTTDMAAAIPVKEGAKIDGYTTLTIPAKKAVQIDYYGEYEGTAKAHYAIDAYLKDEGLLNDVPMIEEYITDPGAEKDPTKWLTKITYYLAE